ncbi:proline-rich protein 12-like [Penaeus indicus]|uniref:proline-rich protein 12-like n=1 Tax=Penaeus indicus TaxID=29960 RepID=UPI00300D8ABC
MSDKQLLETEKKILEASNTTDPQKRLNVITRGAIRQLLSDRERELKEWSPVPKPTPSTSIENATLSATESNRTDTNLADYKTCKDNGIEDNLRYIDDEFSDSDTEIRKYKFTEHMIMKEGSHLRNLIDMNKKYTVVASPQTLKDIPNNLHAQQQTPITAPPPPPVPIETPAPALPLLLPQLPPTKPISVPASAPPLALLQPPPPPPPPPQPMSDRDSEINVVDLTQSTPPPPPPLAQPNNTTQASSNTPQIPEIQLAAGSFNNKKVNQDKESTNIMAITAISSNEEMHYRKDNASVIFEIDLYHPM